jgi:GTP-binding protein
MSYDSLKAIVVWAVILWIHASLLLKVQSFISIEDKRQLSPVESLIGTTSNHLSRASFSRPAKTDSDESNDATATSTSKDFTAFQKSDRSLSYSFFDEAFITVRAGSGGPGSNSYTVRRNSSRGKNSYKRQSQRQQQLQRGKPDGGNGGRGGHVIFSVDKNLNTLAGLAFHPSSSSSSMPFFRAEHGQEGRSKFQNGRSGTDVIIRVPPGTIVQEERVILDPLGNVSTVEWIDIGTLDLLKDDDEDEDRPTEDTTTTTLIVAHGGAGGEGTGVWANGIPSVPRRSPMAGQRKNLKLTLKLIADVAVIGVPNAGKSTFLAAATRAKPKIANYPFTTIVPNLGVAWIPPIHHHKDDNETMEDDSFQRKPLVLCDIPGLIAGAAQGSGLGHAFLRHVERCHVLLHVIDATAEDPIADYRMLNLELVEYGSGRLATVPQIVVVNKADALMSSADQKGPHQQQPIHRSREELEQELRRVMPHRRLLWMSAKNRQGVDELLLRLAAFVEKVKAATAEQEKVQQQQQQQQQT